MDRPTVSVWLELQSTAHGVAGHVRGDGPSTDFVGWLALMETLAARLVDAGADESTLRGPEQ